jgi:hypothetical protein
MWLDGARSGVAPSPGYFDLDHCSSAATSASLRQVLGKTNVTHDARENGDELCLLDPPDRVDGAMCIGDCLRHR